MSNDIRVEFVSAMGSDLTPIQAARISLNSESEEMTEKDEKLIKYLADHQNLTPSEHQALVVIIHCPLFIRSQIHRHRTFSFSEVSLRPNSDNLEFYIPDADDIRSQSKNNKQGSGDPIEADLAQLCQDAMVKITADALKTFEKLIEAGVSQEQARTILPQNLMTKFYATGNLRNWVHFLKLRLDPHAQKEVRVVAEQVAALIQERWPVSFAALMGEK